MLLCEGSGGSCRSDICDCLRISATPSHEFVIVLLTCEIVYQFLLLERQLLVQRCRQTTRCNNFPFINLFNSAPYVSGDKFAHPQEHSLTVYTAFGTMHRHCCRPVPTVEMERQFYLNRGTVDEMELRTISSTLAASSSIG